VGQARDERRPGDTPWSVADPERLGLDFWAALVRASADGITVLDSDCRVVYANTAACELLGHPLHRLLGQDRLSLLPEQERQTYLTFLERARNGDPEPWTAIAYRPDGSELEAELTTTVLDLRGEQFFVVASREVTERHRQARQAAAMAQAAAGVAVGDSIDATVGAIADCALLGTRALAAWVTLDSEEAAWAGATGVPGEFHERVQRAPCACAACSIFLHALTAQRVVICTDARQQLERGPGTACLAGALRSLPWQAAAFAPLVYRGVVVGVLTAIYREDELPREAETSFLAELADQAAMAAATARLVAARRKAVALEERHRLARELHDTVAQSLYGIEQGARMALDRLDQDPPRVAQPIEHVLQLAEAGQAEMRALIFALRPESLAKDGLVTALNTQIEALRARHGIAAQTITNDEPEAPIEVKQVLHRIAQEAVHNTVKHSRARRVDVHLEAYDSWLVLQVTDDGVGFDPDESFPGHFGLHSMRERALEVGGSFEVESSPGRGTRIVVRVPSETRCPPKWMAPPTQPSTEGSRTPSATS